MWTSGQGSERSPCLGCCSVGSGCGQNCPACGGCLQTGGQVAGAEILCRKESGQARRVTLVPVVVARNITWFAHAHCPEASSRCPLFFLSMCLRAYALSQCASDKGRVFSAAASKWNSSRRPRRSGSRGKRSPRRNQSRPRLDQPISTGATRVTLSKRSEAKLLTTHTRTATAVGMLRWTRRRLR